MSRSLDILSLPSVTSGRLDKLPTCPAVYFILSADDRVLYIGSTRNLRIRWVSHGKRRVMAEAQGRVAWREVPNVKRARAIETRLIRKIRPPHNKAPKVAVNVASNLAIPVYDIVREIAHAEQRPLGQMIEILLEESPRVKAGIRLNGNKKAGK